ncbi:MAG: Gfo/Idh/MocA family oxidoreductase [Oscillospiraceae bacterium]
MINFATIGTGWITEKFILATKNVSGLCLKAVYSRDKEKAFSVANKHGASLFFDDLDKMAKEKQIDAVYIASPNSLHFSQAVLFINNKKHVICEKPASLDPLQTRFLFELAQKNGVVFMEAIISNYVPGLRLLNEAIKSIGNVCLAKLDFSQLSSKYPLYLNGNLPNSFNPDFGAGCVMDLGIYCVCLALNLFGEPLSFSSQAVLLPNGIDACGSTQFHYNDKIAVLTYSKVGQSATKSEIIGDKGTVVIEGISSLNSISINYNDSTTQLIHKSSQENAMSYEAEAFYNYITDFDTHQAEYSYNKALSITTSQILKNIRTETGIVFTNEQ